MNPQAFGSNIDSDITMSLDSPVINEPPKREAAPAPYQGKRVWIELQDGEHINPTGQFIGHNGRGFMLKAGEPALVPPEIINILNDAVYDAPIVDPTTQQILGYRKRLRFAYRVLPNGPAAQAA